MLPCVTTTENFAILGPLVVRDAAAAPLTAPKLRGLLALLLLADGPVSPGQIRETLEEHHPRPGSLHVAVHRLRTRIGPAGHRIELEPAGYRLLPAPGETDADRFRSLLGAARAYASTDPARDAALRRALSVWRGPVAADAPVRVRDQHAARRLEHQRREATIELAVSSLRRGTADRSLPLLERLARECPYDERLQSLLALSLATTGCRGEALALLARTRRTLAVQLGVAPGDHLRAAEARILFRRTVPA